MDKSASEKHYKKSLQDLSKRSEEIQRKSSVKKDEVKGATESTAWGLRTDCAPSTSTSHTQYFRRDKLDRETWKKISSDEYCGLPSNSISGSSDTFRCEHGPKGRTYTQKGLLKRNILKKLDPIPRDPKLVEHCEPEIWDWKIVQVLAFMVRDPVCWSLIDRMQELIRDVIKLSSNGYRIDVLDDMCLIFNFLLESVTKKEPYYKKLFEELLKNVKMPISLILASDVESRADSLKNFVASLGYLLMSVLEDDLFDLVSLGLVYQLSEADGARRPGCAMRRHMLRAAGAVLPSMVVPMIAIASPYRCTTYLHLAYLMASDDVKYILEMMKQNILENILCRYNPCFPDDLPEYYINPLFTEDMNLKLGASCQYSSTIPLLLRLLSATKTYLKQNPDCSIIIPYPDEYAQRCFVWQFRYECRKHARLQRSAYVTVSHMLLLIFGNKLLCFGNTLMPDIITLSVQTEIPCRDDWTAEVHFALTPEDVQFKTMLLFACVDFLRVFPYNKFMVRNRHWITGLICLLDPGLEALRTKWSRAELAELRLVVLQVLVQTIDLIPEDLPTQMSFIRRILWYLEWFMENPYDLNTLYWCVRLLQLSIHRRHSKFRKPAVKELLHSHGVIVSMCLCSTLLNQRLPPVERSQSILAMILWILTSCLEEKCKISCAVYPNIKWPSYVIQLITKMMNVALYCLEKPIVCSTRWLVTLMNLIWEGVIWRKENRQPFLANRGLYKLLDIIALTPYPVQCLGLALVCEILRNGDAIGYVITWRASIHVKNCLLGIKPGATIATFLARMFLRDCKASHLKLDGNNIIQDMETPVMSESNKNILQSPEFIEMISGVYKRDNFCLAASELAGSRMSKCYAILQMLSEDLHEKVMLADEAYKLYMDVEMEMNDEILLVLCFHYLTLKLNEVWLEIRSLPTTLLPFDKEDLEEFLKMGGNWAKYIQSLQLEVKERYKKKETEKENSLYAFLGRARLHMSLEALCEARCEARSSAPEWLAFTVLQDAVRAFHRRTSLSRKLYAPIIRTYDAPLDEANVIGHNVNVLSIVPKQMPKKRDFHLEHDGIQEPLNSRESVREMPRKDQLSGLHSCLHTIRESKTFGE